jgi:hypothetical protein
MKKAREQHVRGFLLPWVNKRQLGINVSRALRPQTSRAKLLLLKVMVELNLQS